MPTYATNKNMIWYSDNPNIATVTTNKAGNVTVTALKKGTTFIVAKAEDGGGVYVTCNIEVKQLVTSFWIKYDPVSRWVGETFQNTWEIKPSNADNKNLEWWSSNTSVATVDQSGLVTARRTGSAKITGKTVDGSNLSDWFDFNVWGTTGVSVSPSSLTMTKGETKQLDGSVSYFGSYPGYSWSTNNKSVATVDGAGNVTAKNAGTAKITLTSGTLSASCTVTVKAAAPPAPAQPAATKPATPSNTTVKVTGVKLNTNSLNWKVDQTGTFTATVSPSNATNKNVTWSSSNTNIATVDSKGKLTAVGVGSTTITCTSVADNSKKATCAVKVTELRTEAEKLVYHIKEIEKIVDKYWKTNSTTRLFSDTKNYYTMNIIRSLNPKYTGRMLWRITAGNDMPSDLMGKVKNDARSTYDYFSSNPMVDINGRIINVTHMMATMSALDYPSGLFVDGIANDLAGWAGDLQSFIYDLKLNSKGVDDLNTLKDLSKKIMFSTNTRFDMDDLNADVDAVNIFYIYDVHGWDTDLLSTSIEHYYKNYISYKTYKTFIDYMGGIDNLKSKSEYYLLDSLTGKISGVPWLLYDILFGKSKDVFIEHPKLKGTSDISKNECDALIYGFIENIKELARI
ncbi:hypothetical protein AGMMS50284_5960 [Clostridia bacterium]|nr:hypothetical protein AGMMS50284_5960 [Clostridia bacterium]